MDYERRLDKLEQRVASPLRQWVRVILHDGQDEPAISNDPGVNLIVRRIISREGAGRDGL
jgi:hypothetical protein